MTEEYVKSSSSHIEWEEPQFLQADQELSLIGAIKWHWRALLICKI
jgi:hypothetical protein